MNSFISEKKSIIPSCDVSNKNHFEEMVKQTCNVPGVGAYKVGLELVIPYGLKTIVDIYKKYTNLPIIYDHQKGGTDIPSLGEKFAKVCKNSGVDAVILFPFGGSATEEEWIKRCQDVGLTVIVGGHMTQQNFLKSESGFIDDNAPYRIYEIALQHGVTDFVVPGNKVDLVSKYRALFERKNISYVLYAPGFITQKGGISEYAKVAGDRCHVIIGSAIYRNNNIKEAVKSLTEKL